MWKKLSMCCRPRGPERVEPTSWSWAGLWGLKHCGMKGIVLGVWMRHAHQGMERKWETEEA